MAQKLTARGQAACNRRAEGKSVYLFQHGISLPTFDLISEAE
jgi:hypothetical protein